MATVKQLVGTRTSLTVTGGSTLASATYVASAAYDCTTNQPEDVVVEIDPATTNTPSGNKRLQTFLQISVDGTNYTSGPSSGTTTTDEPNLIFMGSVPMNTASVTQSSIFSVAAACGFCPAKFKVILKNDLGVALTGLNVYTSEISRTVA